MYENAICCAHITFSERPKPKFSAETETETETVSVRFRFGNSYRNRNYIFDIFLGNFLYHFES